MAGQISYPRTAALRNVVHDFRLAVAQARAGLTASAHAALCAVLSNPELPHELRAEALALIAEIEKKDIQRALSAAADRQSVDWINAQPVRSVPKPSPISLVLKGVVLRVEDAARYRATIENWSHAEEHLANLTPQQLGSVTGAFTAVATPDKKARTKAKRDGSERMGDAGALARAAAWLGSSDPSTWPPPERAIGGGSARRWDLGEAGYIYLAGSKNRVDLVVYHKQLDVFQVIEAKGQGSSLGDVSDPNNPSGPRISQGDFQYIGVKAAQMANPSTTAKDVAFVEKVGEDLLDALARGRVIYEVLRTAVSADGSIIQSVEARFDLGGTRTQLKREKIL